MSKGQGRPQGKLSRRQRQELLGRGVAAHAVTAGPLEPREARFRPKTVDNAEWFEKIKGSINRGHPARRNEGVS